MRVPKERAGASKGADETSTRCKWTLEVPFGQHFLNHSGARKPEFDLTNYGRISIAEYNDNDFGQMV
jgi:hypothetical protein